MNCKGVHDVMEEALQTTSGPQLLEMFGFLMEEAHKLEPMVQSEKPKPKTDLLQDIPLSKDLIKVQ